MSAPVKWSDIPNNAGTVWYKDRGLRWNVLHGLGLCCVIATNGYGASLLGGFQAIPAWIKYFEAPKGNLLGLYSACYFLPSVVTSYLGEFISKKYGRRMCIFVGMGLMLVGGFINALCTTIGMWLAGRVIIGAGVGVVKVGAPVLIQEIAHPRLRASLGSCYQGFAYIGTIAAGWMSFAGLYLPNDWSWRVPSLLQVIGPVIVIAVAWHAPESPRWLVKQGKTDQARAILIKYHANGHHDDQLVEYEMRQISAAIASESSNTTARYSDFVRTPGNRRRLAVLIALAFSLNWMGNGIITYYLAPILVSVGITAPVQITLINAGLAMFNFIVAMASAISVDRFGRRPLFLTSVAGMLACYAVIMGLSAGYAMTRTQAMGTAVIPFLYIYFGFYSMAFTPLPIAYTVEIMPYDLRSKGLALFTSCATLGNAFNQFVNPVALQAIAWRYYGVYIGILAFYGCFIYFMLPETKRMTAEEAAMVFDYGRKGRPMDTEESHVQSTDFSTADGDHKEKESVTEQVKTLPRI